MPPAKRVFGRYLLGSMQSAPRVRSFVTPVLLLISSLVSKKTAARRSTEPVGEGAGAAPGVDPQPAKDPASRSPVVSAETLVMREGFNGLTSLLVYSTLRQCAPESFPLLPTETIVSWAFGRTTR